MKLFEVLTLFLFVLFISSTNANTISNSDEKMVLDFSTFQSDDNSTNGTDDEDTGD